MLYQYVKGYGVRHAGSVVHVDMHGERVMNCIEILQAWQMYVIASYVEGC